MIKHEILLSGGSFPWLKIDQYSKLIKQINYNGIEILPTRKINKKTKRLLTEKNLSFIHSIHQNWRLDNKMSNHHRVSGFSDTFLRIIRYIFFPQIKDSNYLIDTLISKKNIPLTVHDISDEWIINSKNEIHLEIFANNIKKENLKKWLKSDNHFVAMDTRDDQSIVWAEKNGFNGWKDFWNWIGLKKIKNIQLTLIGTRGLESIFLHNKSIAEDQFIWLHNKKWTGSVTVEVNPISLFILSKGNIKKGLRIISEFIRITLDKGQKWS